MISFLHLHQFSFDIECASDLHLGSGAFETLLEVDSGSVARYKLQGEEKAAQVATVVRDHHGNPFIPGSSLKGVFNNCLIADQEREFLFGSGPHPDDEDNGIAARAFVHGAVWKEIPRESLPDALPFWNQERNTWIDTHNRIDLRTGIVADKALYSVEYVPAGSIFTVTGCIYGSREEVERTFRKLCIALNGENGFKLGGRQTRRGTARISSDAIGFVETRFDPGGQSVDGFALRENWQLNVSDLRANRADDTFKLVLQSETPFMISDPLFGRDEPRIQRNGENTDEVPDKSYRRRRKRGPAELTSEAVRQNLRNACAFLERSLHWENRERESAHDRKIAADKDVPDLTSTQRLFGVPGWAGMLEIVEITPKGKTASHVAEGIRIDDFTAGVVHGGVFSAQTAIGTRYTVTMRCDTGRLDALEDIDPQKVEQMRDADSKLLKALVAEIGEDGIRLGAMAGTGHGWFDVTIDGFCVEDKRS